MKTIMFGGSSCVIAGLVFALRLPELRARVRPIYIERGILAAAEIEAGSKALQAPVKKFLLRSRRLTAAVPAEPHHED